MKQRLVLTILAGIFATVCSLAQIITDAEYYFDDDPGVGSGVPITLSTPFDTIDQAFDIVLTDTLNTGYHRLYIRTRDVDGKWGLVKGHKFYVYTDANPSTLVPQPKITGLEYYIDTEPGAGMGTWLANSVLKDTLEESLEQAVASYGPGYHKLYARAKDEDGKWGLPLYRKFYVFEDTVVQSLPLSYPLVAAEYFFDDDVPFGQGNPIPVSKGDSVEWTGTIDVTGLEAGEHVLVIRVRDSIGQWSIAGSKPFSVVGLTSSTEGTICQGSSDGVAWVSITGGKPPFTYLWDDPDQQTDSIATGLLAGLYTVTVLDAEGAVINETVEIAEYDTIQVSITTSPTECKQAQGGATAIASGDNPPFKYLWTNGSDEASATGLRSGIYEVTVTDNIGCQARAVATINDINGPDITVTDAQLQNNGCAGDLGGIIAPLVTGGTPPYSYKWSNGETTQAIQNLKAGSYELTVNDAEGCIASTSVKVSEPRPLTYSLSVDPADCGTANGSATVSVYGGTPPYAYTWSGQLPPHNATRTGLGAGVYEVSIADGSGCTTSAHIAVGEKGAPSVNVTAISQSSCGNTDGYIQIAVASSAAGGLTYTWKNETGATVGTSKDLTGVGPGIYSVSVSDGSGCAGFASATIPAELPPVDPICLVTVDTITGRNKIIWNKTPSAGIVTYKLYRETTSANVFDEFMDVSSDSLSEFTDNLADPVVRSWRYRVATVNSCGVESRLSPAHKTMHLTLNLGLLGHVNLLWSHYEGFVPKDNQYKIWRHTPGVGWEMIDVVPSNLNSYTDTSPPDADIWYYVEAEHPTGCTSGKKASTLNSSRSNRKTKLKEAPEGINSFSGDYRLVVYPNPGTGIFRLKMDVQGIEDLDIKVFDMSGKLVHLARLENIQNEVEHVIDLSGMENGMYHLVLKSEGGVCNKMIIKE